MNRRRGKGGGGRQPPVKVVAGSRAMIEHAWLNAVMGNVDPRRIAQLERMLAPAANDAFEAMVVSADGPLPSADLVDEEAPKKS